MDPIQVGTWDWISDALKGVWGLVLTLLGFIGLRAHRAIDKHEEQLATLEKEKVDQRAAQLLEERLVRSESVLISRLNTLDEKMDRRHEETTSLLFRLARHGKDD